MWFLVETTISHQKLCQPSFEHEAHAWKAFMAVSLVCKNGCGRDCGQGPDGRVPRRTSWQRSMNQKNDARKRVSPKRASFANAQVFPTCCKSCVPGLQGMTCNSGQIFRNVDRICGGQTRQHGRILFQKVFFKNNAIVAHTTTNGVCWSKSSAKLCKTAHVLTPRLISKRNAECVAMTLIAISASQLIKFADVV